MSQALDIIQDETLTYQQELLEAGEPRTGFHYDAKVPKLEAMQ